MQKATSNKSILRILSLALVLLMYRFDISSRET